MFSSDRDGTIDLYEKSTRGQGGEKQLLHSDEVKFASSWSHDGRYIAFSSQHPKSGWDIWALPTFGDRKPIPILVAPFAETHPVFSPDGHFVAYASSESGRAEIYVQTFPDGAGKWQVSNSGGGDPSWRGDGKELFYRTPDQKLMAVEIRTAGGSVQAGIPQALFSVRIRPGNARNKYIPSADGQRFLFDAPLERESMSPTTIVLNWPASLGR